MSGALKQSLASWRHSHGFGILNVVEPSGEHFLVETRRSDEPVPGDAWVDMTEREVRDHLARNGFAAADIDDAIVLAREWATTISGGSALAGSS